MNNRYLIKIGKWGLYFFDQIQNKDLNLEEVQNKLRILEDIRMYVLSEEFDLNLLVIIQNLLNEAI
jgi:hypothetical protein